MKRTLYFYLWACLGVAGLSSRSIAQTITTGPISPTSVCSGGPVSVAYTVSASFTNGNTFSAQLSDAAGTFSASLIVIGTLKSTTSGVISALVPASAAAGTAYRIRVVSTTPAQTSAVSSASLTINSPAAPSVLSPVTYCEGATATPLAATASAGSVLKWYDLTGTSTGTTATLPNTKLVGPASYSVSQVTGGCESPRSVITVNVSGRPATPAITSVSYCVGQTAPSLTAKPAAGATLNWYTVATGGTGSSVAPIPKTTTPGSTTYYASQTIAGCESDRASLVVTVNSVPAAPTFTAPAAYCEGAIAVALSATGNALKWYGTDRTGGTGSTTATVPGTSSASIGSTSYYVTQTVNGCESTRAAIAVQVKDTPVAPGVKNVDFCQGTTPASLTATLLTGATPNWYGATGGSPSAVAPTPLNTSAGTTIYYVSQTLSGCESPRSPISVRVNALPAAPVVSPASFCNNAPATSLTATGTSLKWYDASGALLPAAPTPGTGNLGNQVYNVSQTSAGGCEGPKATLTVTINPLPVSPSAAVPRAYCQGETASPLVATGSGLKWYGTDSTNRTPATSATVPFTSPAYIGTRNYYVTQTVLGCESYVRAIPVAVKVTPNLPTVQDVSFCQNYPAATLVATPVANASLNWYGESASGGTASAAPPTIPNTVDKTYTYYVSQTLDGCESGLGSASGRAPIRARVKPTPAAPGINPISFCNNGPSQALTAAGSGLKWYDATDNLLGAAPTPATNAVGNQLYKVTQSSGEGCESPKASLPVTINALPGQPGTADLTYCQIQQDQPAQNIIPLTASGQNLKWYTASSNMLDNAPIPTINQAGVQSYQVSQTVNNCEGAKATIRVTVNTLNAPTTPKPTVTYCVNAQAVPLEAIGDPGSQLRWVDPYGRITNNAPTPSTLNTNIILGGDPFYVYQIGQNGCYSPRATIKAVVTSTPTLALIAPATSTNLGQRVPLRLQFTSTGPFTYTITGGYTGRSLTADTTIMVLPRQSTIYQVESVSNGCGTGLPGNPATAQITVRVPTVVTSAVTASTLCAGSLLTVPFTTTGDFNSGNVFRIELVSVADTNRKYSVPSTALGSPVTGVLSATLPGGDYAVRVKADNPEIGIVGTNSPTVLTVRTVASAVMTGNQTIYEASPASLTLTLGGSGPWSIVFADSLRSYPVTAAASPYIAEVRPTKTTTYRLTSVTNFCGAGAISGSATVRVLPLLGVIDNPLDPLVKTYPVPTSTTLMVELDVPLTREQATLSLTDASGRPVLQRTTRNKVNELDLTAQPSGLYLLRIQVGDRQTVRKVLKQ